MTEAAGTFDAWGSSLIGGLAGALAVLVAVFVTFSLTNRKARETERREDAARLMVEVSNLRDAACSHRTGPIGDYKLFQLRTALYTTYVALNEYPSFRIVDDFYETVKKWRKWARDHDDRASTASQWTRSARIEESFPWTTEYMEQLAEYGEKVISVLKKDRESAKPDFTAPVLPEFDDVPVKPARKGAIPRKATP